MGGWVAWHLQISTFGIFIFQYKCLTWITDQLKFVEKLNYANSIQKRQFVTADKFNLQCWTQHNAANIQSNWWLVTGSDDPPGNSSEYTATAHTGHIPADLVSSCLSLAPCHQGVTSRVTNVTLSGMRTSSPGRLSHQRTLTSVWQ